MPLPEWYKDGPEIMEVELFYLGAFYELSTCRQLGMAVGPIPWTALLQFATYAGLDREMTDCFIQIVRGLDAEYLDYVSKKGK